MIKKKKKIKEIVCDLEKKKTELSYKTGALVFSFNKNPLIKVNSYKLAMLQDVMINEPCKKNCMEKLKYYVQTLKITHLYVQGYQQAQYLKK